MPLFAEVVKLPSFNINKMEFKQAAWNAYLHNSRYFVTGIVCVKMNGQIVLGEKHN